jgi:hypothetical protein
MTEKIMTPDEKDVFKKFWNKWKKIIIMKSKK